MDKLRQHLMWCLQRCAKDHKELWLHQAFGAVQFYAMTLDNHDFTELETLWNVEFKPHFERHIWGQSLSI